MRALGLVFAVLLVAACKSQEPAQARVDCRAAGLTLAEGFVCSAEHVTGGPLRVCWNAKATCPGGVVADARECANLRPGQKASVALPTVSNADKCSAVTRFEVADVNVANFSP
jgi:hypothetical protein